ncbi:hypothetical protein [Aeromonas enteropelogenes]|uniref:hypothetical protein n=1 Tax=Aeromonas enteropelogenes TaxID=29489 RepID=UPI003BA0B899
MNDDMKIAHLGFIQNIILRMAGNSFAIKGWSISLTAAIIAAGIALKSLMVIFLACIPVLFFIYLDSYFFLQEKNFRNLYNIVRVNEFDKNNPFDLTPPENISSLKITERLVRLGDKAVYPIYISQIVVIVLTLVIMAKFNP